MPSGRVGCSWRRPHRSRWRSSPARRATGGEASRLGQPLIVIRSDRDLPFEDRELGRLLYAADAEEQKVDIELRRSTAPAGQALAEASRHAVLTISGRPTEAGARGFRPLGRTNSELLLNAAGPVVIVPHVAGD